MFAHAQVIIAAPHSDVPAILHLNGGVLELFGCGGAIGRASQDPEPSIRAILHLGFDLTLEESIIVQFAISYEQIEDN